MGMIKGIWITISERYVEKLYQLIDQFNKRKIDHKDTTFVLPDNVHPFYDGNGRTYNFNKTSSIVNKDI